MENELKSGLCKIPQIFTEDNMIFSIPGFQRSFVWNRDNVREMFNDFAEDTYNYTLDNSLLSGYLLGNIVLIKSEDPKKGFVVVDGQQRLTTLSLIYKCISNRFNSIINDSNNLLENKNAVFRKAGEAEFNYKLIDENDHVIDLRIKHDQSLSYTQVYREILNDSYDDTISNNDSSNNLIDVWEEVQSSIESLNDEEFNKFVQYLNTKVKLIRTISPSDSKAFQLFEVLNNRGQTLEPLDLIKNLLLKRLNDSKNKGILSDTDIESFNKYWNSFQRNLSREKIKNPSSTFLRYFLMMEYGVELGRDDLFDFFKYGKFDRKYSKQDNNLIIQGNDIINFARNIDFYSMIYDQVDASPRINDFSSSNELYVLFKILGVRQFHPIFMLFYKEKSNDIKKKVINACLRMGIITIYSFDMSNKVLSKVRMLVTTYRNSMIETNNNINASVDKMISKMDEYINELEDVLRSSLSKRKISKNKAMDLLKLIEILVNNHLEIIERPKPGGKIELEHILPQEPSMNVTTKDLGMNNYDDYSTSISLIGNLTLIRKSDNAKIKNNTFKNKKIVYQNTDIIITKALAGNVKSNTKNGIAADFINKITKYEKSYENYNLWTKRCIEMRGMDIANLLADYATNRIM